MDVLQIREYCLSLGSDVEETTPFGDDNIVFKTGGRMFALVDIQTAWLAVKCDPERAVELREQYEYVTPAYHFNKKHWNGIEASVAPAELLRQWIRDSFKLVNAQYARKKGK